MPFQSQLYQLVNELREAYPADFPEPGVHAHGREPRDGVYLIDENRLIVAAKEEVYPRHTAAIDRPESGQGQGLEAGHQRGLQLGRRLQVGPGVQVFGVIVIELPGIDHLTRNRYAGVVVSQNAAFYLPTVDRFLQKDLQVVAEGQLEGPR